MSEIDKKWYVVRAIGGQENKAKDFLESEISAAGLSDYVGQILIPTEKVLQIRNGKKVTKERNHFPGYVFVECALVGEVPHVIRNTPSVIGFLGAEKRGDPLPLRPNEVSRMLGRVDELAESEEELAILQGRGDREGGRWPVQRIPRHHRRNQRGEAQAEGDGEDFWTENPSRAGLPPSGEGELKRTLNRRVTETNPNKEQPGRPVPCPRMLPWTLRPTCSS